LIDDGATGTGQSVLVFRNAAVAQKASVIRRFLKAYERAVDEINADPQRYRALLVEKAKVPDPVKETFVMPPLPKAAVPKEDAVKAAFDWMTTKGLLKRNLTYSEVVDATLLPK
jgi:NitT/TauT family transport system substrate-binding protein